MARRSGSRRCLVWLRRAAGPALLVRSAGTRAGSARSGAAVSAAARVFPRRSAAPVGRAA
jgi:hypothetical protein